MKMIDKKIKKLVKGAVRKNHRSLIVILGSSGYLSVPSIYHLLAKVNKKDIPTLWCSRDGNSTLKSKNQVQSDPDINSLDISDFKPLNCSYSNLEGILHEAFQMVVLQDLDAASSNILSLNAILPNVKGGGAVVILIPSLNSIEQLKSFSLNEDKQSSRFYKRFVQSFDLCSSLLITDGNLNLLSSSKIVEKPDEMVALPSLSERIESMKSKCDNSIMESLLHLCLTGDQAELLYKFLDTLKTRTFHSVVSASSAFGRGKSAALGLAIAGAIAMNYSNIFISSSSLDNVNILFRFLLKGLDALNYEEDKHYDLIESTNPQFKQALIGLNVFKDYPQSVRFIFPDDVGHKLEQAELVVVDEAASIPYHKLKPLFGPYTVLMSSSTSGAISTSPFLFKKMMENIQSTYQLKGDLTLSSGSLQTFILNEPIYYNSDDSVESWCNHIFCTKTTVPTQLSHGFPATNICELYCVSRDALFCGSAFTEKYLQSIMAILNHCNYESNIEELLKLADSPDYQLFVLLPPSQRNSNSLEVLCAILVHLESYPSTEIVNEDLSKFCGVQIIKIATHPLYKKMGYGLQALKLLMEFYEGKLISLDEKVESASDKEETALNKDVESPLLLQLSDLNRSNIDYIWVSFNLSSDIFSFWAKADFSPLDITAIKDSGSIAFTMLKATSQKFNSCVEEKIETFMNRYFVALKCHCKMLPALLALNILHCCKKSMKPKDLSKEELDLYLKPYQMKLLENYCLSLQDLNTVIHIIPVIARLYFKMMLKNVHLPRAQEAILLSYGLQSKSIDVMTKELELQSIQVIGLLNRTLKKCFNYITTIIEKTIESTLFSTDVEMKPIDMDLDKELEEAALQVQKQDKLEFRDLAQYAIKGSEDEWQKANFGGRKTLVSIKSIKHKNENPAKTENEQRFRKHKKQFKKKKH